MDIRGLVLSALNVKRAVPGCLVQSFLYQNEEIVGEMDIICKKLWGNGYFEIIVCMCLGFAVCIVIVSASE